MYQLFFIAALFSTNAVTLDASCTLAGGYRAAKAVWSDSLKLYHSNTTDSSSMYRRSAGLCIAK